MPLTSSIFSKVLALSKNSTGFMMYYILLSLKCIMYIVDITFGVESQISEYIKYNGMLVSLFDLEYG